MSGARRRLAHGLLLVVLAGLLPVAQAQEATLEQARQLAAEGRHAAALERVDAFLATHPDDARGRFLRGVLLVETGREEAAIAAFDGLTEDHPELPEPYNNLAVLYAARGDYEEARDVLLRAINTHPSYAIAHENLGDIYARLAGIAYDRALMLDGQNTAARSKLALVDELFSGEPAVLPATRGAAVSEPARPEAQRAPAPVDAVATAAPPPTPETPTPAPVAAVRDTVLAWARAWSLQDAPTYLSFYGRGFRPPGEMPRTAWEAQRRERLSAPAFIELALDDIEVDMRGIERARAVFTQSYRSDTYADRVRKVLDLALEQGEWRIVSEVSEASE